MNDNQTHHTSPLWPIGIFFLCTAFIALTFYVLFEKIKANERADTNKTLISVGQLKTNQILSYLDERKADAAVLSRFLFTPPMQHWLSHQSDSTPAILNQLAESAVTAYQYRGLLVLDSGANIRFINGHSGMLTDAGKTIALRVMRERSPAFFQIYFGDPSHPDVPVLDTFVPIMSLDGAKVMGMIVMRSELDYLFKLIQTWPIESRTAESLLVTKDGDDVLFLNELRYQKNTALKLRIPIKNKANARIIPTLEMVGKGRFGLIEGYDYRGHPTLGYNIAVPDTPWGMSVKMDLDEAEEHSLKLQHIAMITASAFIVFTEIIVWLWWRKDNADRLASRQLLEAESRYRRLYESMMDAFVMVDMSGRFLEFNPAYQEMLGYSAEELHRLSCVELTPEKWHEFEARIIEEQVIAHGYSQVYEKEYIHKDGTVFPVELKAFLLQNANNQPEAMWAIVRDITERKQAEMGLRKSAEEIEDLYNHAPCGYHSLDKDGIFRQINDTELAWLGYSRDEVIWKMKLTDVLTTASIQTCHETFPQLMQQGYAHNIELEIIRKDGTTFTGLINASAIYDSDRNFVMSRSTLVDITERKQAERKLQELSAHLQIVREEEKTRIAREIHDDLGGTLTALKMDTFWLAKNLPADKAVAPLLKRVNSMSQLLDNAVGVTRRIITDLRPSILDDLGLLAALEWQAEQFHKRTGISCRVHCIENKCELDKKHTTALYRIFQETLTNVARHSGANKVEVEFHCDGEEVMLAINDNGRGLPEGHIVASTSFGVRGMLERVEQLGGTIKLYSPPGGGFHVMVIFPLSVEKNNGAKT